MARVSVEQAARSDPRFPMLGKILGRGRYDALGRMIDVWDVCQERGVYALPIELIDCLYDDIPDFAAAIVRSGLGRPDEDDPGAVYIAGTRGRIEWLQKKRTAAQENGRKSHGRPPKETKTGTDIGYPPNQDGFPAADPLAPAPAPATCSYSKPDSKKRPYGLFDVASDAFRLADLHLQLVRERDSKAKGDAQKWAKDVDQIIRLDGRTPEEIERVIRWSQADAFEQANILSGSSLRKRFGALLQKSNATPRNTQQTNQPRRTPHNFEEFNHGNELDLTATG